MGVRAVVFAQGEGQRLTSRSKELPGAPRPHDAGGLRYLNGDVKMRELTANEMQVVVGGVSADAGCSTTTTTTTNKDGSTTTTTTKECHIHIGTGSK